jgi:hypothetical protein
MALLDQTASASPPGWAFVSGTVLAALLDRLVANDTITAAGAAKVVSEARAGIKLMATSPMTTPCSLLTFSRKSSPLNWLLPRQRRPSPVQVLSRAFRCS